jgi:hypothetical protein
LILWYRSDQANLTIRLTPSVRFVLLPPLHLSFRSVRRSRLHRFPPLYLLARIVQLHRFPPLYLLAQLDLLHRSIPLVLGRLFPPLCRLDRIDQLRPLSRLFL